MKTFISLALAGLLTSTALAAVSVRVYRADEQTPLEWADPNVPDLYQDIMVGTRLTCFVVSDANEIVWSGGMQVSWDNWSRGILTGRGFNPDSKNYDGSVLPASGQETYIYSSLRAEGMRIPLSVEASLAGEWIVLDYHAKALGICNIGVYASKANEVPPDFSPALGDDPPGGSVWIQGLSFNHVPSRDYSANSIVNFVDFALWANQWQETIVPDPNAPTPGDLNADEFVDLSDLALFCDFWLERTDILEPSSEPNDPNVTLPEGTDTGIL